MVRPGPEAETQRRGVGLARVTVLFTSLVPCCAKIPSKGNLQKGFPLSHSSSATEHYGGRDTGQLKLEKGWLPVLAVRKQRARQEIGLIFSL